jgi:hypothetical protein
MDHDGDCVNLIAQECPHLQDWQLLIFVMKVTNWGRQMLSDVIITFLRVVTSSSKV